MRGFQDRLVLATTTFLLVGGWHDPALAEPVLVIILGGVIAAYLPARQASLAGPMEALRLE